jgi:phage terminase large subunit-like protein
VATVALSAEAIARWRQDPAAFIEEVLADPETKRPFTLYPEQKTFLRHAFELTPEDKMRYTELLFSAPKKSGKSALAAMVCIYTAVLLAPRGGEIYLLANDFEQSQSRVFKAVVDMLKVSPLHTTVDLTASKIVFRPTGTTIIAVANDFRGFAGANPTLNCYDESAYYQAEGSRRLWDEGIPSPARRISFRLSVSTAGFDGEPSPLRDLYDRAMEHGTEIAPDLRVHENLLCYWACEVKAPWQSESWVNEMRRTYASRPAQFQRLICNQWVSAESTFIDLEQWDRCTDPNLLPLLAKSGLPVWAALDLGLKHDSTALIACAWDGDRVRLVEHRVFVPHAGETLDIESTAEAAILSLRSRFCLMQVVADPWQAYGLLQRLVRAGINATEYPQTLPNLSLMAGNLIDLLRTRTLLLYPDADLRAAAAKTISIESSRGFRLGKAKQSDRVDPIISLAMAALACVQAGSGAGRVDHAFQAKAAALFHNMEMLRTGQTPRRGSQQEIDAIEDAQNDRQRQSNPLRTIRSNRWPGGRGGW